MQLLLGVQLRRAKRLRKYAGALIEGGLPTDPDKLQKGRRTHSGDRQTQGGTRQLRRPARASLRTD